MKSNNQSILALSLVACLSGLSAPSFAQKSSQAKAQDWPQARFEQNNYQSTSTVADVAQFMAALQKKDKSLTTYQPKTAPRNTETGQALNAWRLAATGKDPLRVYINAGIHAGEVEGKDAMQIILRELVQGKYPEIRQAIEIVTLPTYNADGADAQDPLNRRHQPNPDHGVGPRENVFGIDLNRDMMKAAAANTRWMLAMYQDFQPAAVFDLHTTNGSYHGFHITYEPAWATGGDAPLQALNRKMLTDVRATMLPRGMPTYDYGNFRFNKDKQIVAWESAFSSPNLVSNYPTLQYALGILVESYVYRSFKDRIEDNRLYVVELLRWLAANKEQVKREQIAAKARWADQWKSNEARLPLRTEMSLAETYSFDVVDPIKDTNGQIVGEKSRTKMDLPAYVAFKAVDEIRVPQGYLVDPAYAEKLRPILEAHGLKVLPGSARPKDQALMYFHETERNIAKDTFQGIFTAQIKGQWKEQVPEKRAGYTWTKETLDKALYVPLNQPLGRLGFYLLDPRSADGLVYWGYLHAYYARGKGMWGEPPRQPILAVGSAAANHTAESVVVKPERVQE
nr:M14 family zinc carboxypeptidase [uncultured Undibacterium sp.]